MGPLAAALPIIGAVAGIGGTAVSMIGAQQTADAQQANANYQAQVARNNAAIARQNATWETQSGEIQAATQGMKARAGIGSLLASQGASGVDVNSGSSAAVRSSAEALGTLDTRTIMSNAAKRAYSYQVAGSNDLAQSDLYKQQGDKAETAGDINTLGSFLSGISSVGNNWVKYQNFAGAT